MRYIIVGAGITGLYLAYKLQKQGYAVLVLEKNNDLGGLAGITKIQGNAIEKAYHHYFPSDQALLNLLDELGLKSAMTWRLVPMGVLMNEQIFPFSTPLDLLRLPNMTMWEKVRLGLATRRLQKVQDWQAQCHITAEEWLIKNCGKNVYKQFWKPLLKGKFHDHYKKISLSWLWARLYSRGQAKKSIFTQEKLGYLEGSISILIEALAKKLTGKILMGQNIISVKKSLTGTVVKTDKKTYYANKLIFTTPINVVHDLIKDIFPQERVVTQGQREDFPLVGKNVEPTGPKNLESKDQKNINISAKKKRKVQYIGAVVGMFATPQLLTNYYWINVNDVPQKSVVSSPLGVKEQLNIKNNQLVPAPIIVFINHTALVSKQLFKGQYVYYYGAYLPHDHAHFKDTTLFTKNSLTYLKKIFPHFDPTLIVEQKVNKLAFAQHIVDTKYHQSIPPYRLYEDCFSNTERQNSDMACSEKGVFYLCNYSQIYPFDRGVNHAIVNADTFLETLA